MISPSQRTVSATDHHFIEKSQTCRCASTQNVVLRVYAAGASRLWTAHINACGPRGNLN